jgi:hypothetical protein
VLLGVIVVVIGALLMKSIAFEQSSLRVVVMSDSCDETVRFNVSVPVSNPSFLGVTVELLHARISSGGQDISVYTHLNTGILAVSVPAGKSQLATGPIEFEVLDVAALGRQLQPDPPPVMLDYEVKVWGISVSGTQFLRGGPDEGPAASGGKTSRVELTAVTVLADTASELRVGVKMTLHAKTVVSADFPELQMSLFVVQDSSPAIKQTAAVFISDPFSMRAGAAAVEITGTAVIRAGHASTAGIALSLALQKTRRDWHFLVSGTRAGLSDPVGRCMLQQLAQEISIKVPTASGEKQEPKEVDTQFMVSTLVASNVLFSPGGLISIVAKFRIPSTHTNLTHIAVGLMPGLNMSLNVGNDAANPDALLMLRSQVLAASVIRFNISVHQSGIETLVNKLWLHYTAASPTNATCSFGSAGGSPILQTVLQSLTLRFAVAQATSYVPCLPAKSIAHLLDSFTIALLQSSRASANLEVAYQLGDLPIGTFQVLRSYGLSFGSFNTTFFYRGLPLAQLKTGLAINDANASQSAFRADFTLYSGGLVSSYVSRIISKEPVFLRASSTWTTATSASAIGSLGFEFDLPVQTGAAAVQAQYKQGGGYSVSDFLDVGVPRVTLEGIGNWGVTIEIQLYNPFAVALSIEEFTFDLYTAGASPSRFATCSLFTAPVELVSKLSVALTLKVNLNELDPVSTASTAALLAASSGTSPALKGTHGYVRLDMGGFVFAVPFETGLLAAKPAHPACQFTLAVEVLSVTGLSPTASDLLSNTDAYVQAYMPHLCPMTGAVSSYFCSSCSGGCFTTTTKTATSETPLTWKESFTFVGGYEVDTPVVFKVLDKDVVVDDLLFEASMVSWGASGSIQTLTQGSSQLTVKVTYSPANPAAVVAVAVAVAEAAAAPPANLQPWLELVNASKRESPAAPAQMCIPQPGGRHYSLVVEVVSASGLRDADTFSNSDPYAMAYLPGRCPLTHASSAACATCTSCFQTTHVSDTSAPTWSAAFVFPGGVALDTEVVFKVLDDDTASDDLLLAASITAWGGSSGSTRTLTQGGAQLLVKLSWSCLVAG